MLAGVALGLVLAAEPSWTEPHSRELTVYPFVPRLGEFVTRQYAFAGSFAWPIGHSLAVTFGGQVDYQPLAKDESDPCRLSPCRAIARSPPPYGLMVAGAALLGLEFRPWSTELFFYDWGGAELSLVLGTGVGAAATRWQFNTMSEFRPTTWVDTGWRVAAQFGAGLRVRVRWVTLRLELRDLMIPSGVDTVNGCTRNDLRAIDTSLRAGGAVGGTPVSSRCDLSRWEGTDAATGYRFSDEVPISHSLTLSQRGLLLNFVQVYAGLGLAF